MSDDYSEVLCRFSGEPSIERIEIEHYADRMPYILERRVPDAILLRPNSLESFVTVMFWVDAMHERGYRAPHLLLPYAPGARQDRLTDTRDVLFTAKSVAGMVNARAFPSVAILDPHSDVIGALLDRCTVLQPEIPEGIMRNEGGVPSAAGASGPYVGVIAPRASAQRSASIIAAANRLPLFHGWQTHDQASGAISASGMQTLPVGHYLVADDVCDDPAPLASIAQQIRALACTADLYVTHGIFKASAMHGIIKSGELLKGLRDVYGRVICTDSVIGEKEGAIVLDRCQHILRAFE